MSDEEERRKAYERKGHDPLAAGLWQRVVLGGAVNPAGWAQAEESAEVIGTCRRADCGGYLVVDSPLPYGPTALAWYCARCLKCGHEVASPGGRLLRRSGRWSERPTGDR